MDKKKIIFIIGGILLIALIIFLVFKFKGDKNEGRSYSSNGDNNRTSSVSNTNNQNNELNSQSENKTKNSSKSSNQSSSNNSEKTEKQYSGGKTYDGKGWRIDSCLIKGQDEIIVPNTIAGYPVTEIGENAFATVDCKKIVLPDTVKSIERGAFSLCDNLEEIDLGKSLTYITSMAFNNCSSLKEVRFPEGMTTIDDAIFYECPKLGEIYIPSSVTTFPDGYMFFTEFCPNAVIVTPAGSAAEKYAIEYNLPYKNK